MKLRSGIVIVAALGAAALASAQGQYDPYRGYGGGGYYGGGYGQPRYDQGYGYGRNDGRVGPAYQIGYEDGRRDGERDAYTGHSFRPTHSENFRHADRGYHRDFGPKQFYKDTYRSGYTEGYRSGYSVRGRRW